MSQRESDALSAAMAGTDAELFAAALGNDAAVHDDTGDRSLEQQDGGLEGRVEDGGEETEVETEVAADEADGDGKTEVEAKDGEEGKPERDAKGQFVKKPDEAESETEAPAKDGRVPSFVIREKTEKANAKIAAAETERDALKAAREEDKRERDALKAQMDLLARQVAQRQQPEPKADVQAPADPEPDMFAQPEEWRAWNRRENAREIAAVRSEGQNRFVNASLYAAQDAHGEKFTEAWQAFLQVSQANSPEAEVLKQNIRESYNPGAELMKWHRQQEVLREFGADPAAAVQKKIDAALEAKINDPEFRKSLLDKWNAEARGANANGSPRHITRVPHKQIPSLNGASGSAQLSDPSFDDASEEGFFNRALAG